MKTKKIWQRAPLNRLPRILSARGPKRLWLKDRGGTRHVLLPFSDYAELLAYKRHALSWAELSAEEQDALHQQAKQAQVAADATSDEPEPRA